MDTLTPMQKLRRIISEWFAIVFRILFYSVLQILMVGILFGGAYLTVITLWSSFDVCITLTLGIVMFILGGVMIHHWIKDVMRE